MVAPVPAGPAPPSGPANYSLNNVGWDNQQYASGPWPHSRYVNRWSGTWTADLSQVTRREGGESSPSTG